MIETARMNPTTDPAERAAFLSWVGQLVH